MASSTEIDGSVFEGGGQILRLAMSLSSLLRKPIKVTKIRAKRAKPGLKMQHLKGLQMASEMCGGNLSGAATDATEITYHPGVFEPGHFEADTSTAGSIALLMQVGIPIALFALSPTFLVLKGGTNAYNAPTIDYVINVFLPTLRKFGGDFDCTIRRRGYYPKGGGIVNVQIFPVTTLVPVTITEFGILTRIWGRSYVVGTLPFKMAHTMANAAVELLSRLCSSRVSIEIERVKDSPENAFAGTISSGIVLFAETSTKCILSGSAIGKKGWPPYEVGKHAAEELAGPLGGQHCLDSYLQDQVVILMALAQGKSVVKCGPITEHTKSAIYITEMLTNATFTIKETSNFSVIECEGIGFKHE